MKTSIKQSGIQILPLKYQKSNLILYSNRKIPAWIRMRWIFWIAENEIFTLENILYKNTKNKS